MDQRRLFKRFSVAGISAGVIALMSTTLASTAARADDSTKPKDPITFLGPNADQYVALFANYYQTIDGLITIGDFVYNLANSSPSVEDLLNQIKEQIMTELKSERDDGITWLAESAASQFDTDILGDPTNDTAHSRVDILLNDASNARISMMHVIQNGTPDEAYRMAPHFVAVSALYNAMLRFNGYDQNVINAHLEESVAIDYLLVGARDAGCSMASGINTSFGSKIFQNKYINQPYYCSVVWQCVCQPDGFCGEASMQCEQGSGNNTFCGVSANNPNCITPAGAEDQCISEARASALWTFENDLVTAIVRADLDRALNQLGGWHVSDPVACSGTDLSLFAWSELCNGDCIVSDMAKNPSAVASQSSTLTYGDITANAGLAIDGNTDGNFWDGSVTHTGYERGWWQVDLGFEATIGRVDIWNRSDCCADRLKNINLQLSNDGVNWVSAGDVSGILGYPSEVFINKTTRFLRIALSGTDYLSLAEVQIFPFGQ